NTESAGIDAVVVTEHESDLRKYMEKLRVAAGDSSYASPESAVHLPSDDTALADMQKVIAEKTGGNPPAHIVVIGIGGSNLGAKAVYDALFGHYDALEARRSSKMIFLDTVDAVLLEKTSALLSEGSISPKDFLIFVISKSGGTTETIANAEILFALLKARDPDFLERVIAITDNGSPLWNIAHEKNIAALEIRKNVGGRFSVFSAVGFAPLHAAGIDITALREGAQEMREACLSEAIRKNPAMSSALALFVGLKNGRAIHDTFVFNPALESLGRWYRQLLAESVGKEKDLNGNIVHAGITPTVSVGSTDLHSMGQLYLGGPKDKITAFISVQGAENDLLVPSERVFSDLVPMIHGKSAHDIMQAILEGTRESYRKNGIPFIDVSFPNISEYSLGSFMQWRMMEIMYLGALMNVNAFDQPNVKAYKEETRTILERL
ncbi:hypothetical protein L0Y49_01450, partial [bacterium]|nr:hypothetical protein [bacterium]